MKRCIPMIVAFTLIMLVVGTTFVIAQDPPVLFPEEPDQTPIDGGLIWLLIGGGAYGIKKLREQDKAKE